MVKLCRKQVNFFFFLAVHFNVFEIGVGKHPPPPPQLLSLYKKKSSFHLFNVLIFFIQMHFLTQSLQSEWMVIFK